MDNFIIHRSTHRLAVLERSADWLEIVGLPTYTPQLNLIERLWTYLRRKVTHTHLYDTMDPWVAAVVTFIDHLTHQPHIVRSICGHPA